MDGRRREGPLGGGSWILPGMRKIGHPPMQKIKKAVMLPLLVLALVIAPQAIAIAPFQSNPYESVEAKKEIVAVPKINYSPSRSSGTIAIPAILKKIAYCESGDRQFNSDGTVIRGRENPQDVGRFQINLTFHATTAKAMGLDLFSYEGNTRYALYLYRTQGTQPWFWSKGCWG